MVGQNQLDNASIVSSLNDLIETCRDGQQGFQEAAANTDDGQLKRMFNDYAVQRARFIQALQAEVQHHGGDPQQRGSVSAALHRGWLNLKAAIARQEDEALLEEAERGEDVAMQTYQQALEKPWPAHLRDLVYNQYIDVKGVHDHIRTLRDAYQRR